MRQRRRRITAMLLAAAMSVSVLPNLSVAFAAPTEVTNEATPRAGAPQVGDDVTLTSADTTNAVDDSEISITQFFTITITGNDTCSIKEFNRQSNKKSIKIPSYVTLSNGDKTYTVTAIGENAFASCGLSEISFRGLEGDEDAATHPCGITSIGANAFASNLFSEITLPEGVTTIGDGAFSGASALKTINLDKLTFLTSIGANAFRNCTVLEELDLSATTLQTIGMQAFYSSKALKYIKLPNTITSIGSQAFSDVADSCFIDCSLIPFNTPGAPWGGTGAVIYWGNDAERGYNNNSPYIFNPETGLIYGLKIGSAKYDTENNKYIIDESTKKTNINYWYYGKGTFNGDKFENKYTGFEVTTETKSPSGAPEDAKVYLVNISELPEKIDVGTWTDEGFTKDREVTVKGLADGAFGSSPGNVAIKTINFSKIKGGEDGMTEIPYGAFWYATNLTEVSNIPEGVTSVGTYAFRKCTTLGKIELPSTVQEVNQWAFRECDALTEVTFNTRAAATPSPAPEYKPPTAPGALTPIEDGNTYYTITQQAGEEVIGYIQGEIEKPTEEEPVLEASVKVSLSKVVELNGRYYVYKNTQNTYAPTVSLKWSDDGDGNGHYTGEITDYEYDSEIVYFAEAETLSPDNAKDEKAGSGETPAPDVAAAENGTYSGGKFSATKSQSSVTYLGDKAYTKGTYSLTAYYIKKNNRGVEIRTATQSENKSADNCLLKLIKKNDSSKENSEIIKDFTLNSEEKIGISGWLNGGTYNQGAWIDYVILRKTAEEQTCDIKQIHSGAFSKCKVLAKISMKGQFSDTDEKIYVTGTSDDDDPAAASAPFGAYDANIEYKDGTFDKTNVTSVEYDGIWTFNRFTGDVIGYDQKNNANVSSSNCEETLKDETITIPTELSYKKSDGTNSEQIEITGVGQYDENLPLFNAYNKGRVWIKNIEIPEGIVRINDSAFYKTRIVSGKVKIPDSVESIRYRAFSNCGLTELTLPANLKTMGSYAFGNYGESEAHVMTNDITGTVVFPRHIESIPNDVFSGYNGSKGNENINTIHIQQYRYLDTDAGYPDRTGTFRQAAPEVYNNAPFGAKQDSEKASTVEYEDAYVPVLSDPDDPDHYHPTAAIEGKPDKKSETTIDPDGEGGVEPIAVKGGTARINLALIMENSAFTIINAKSGVENESNEYFKNAAVTVTRPQLQGGAYDGSQPYELNVTGITGNGSFVIEYSYGDVDGNLLGTNAVEIPIDCFHTVAYHGNGEDSGVVPQLGAGDGNGDDHYYVEGFNVPVKENDGNGKEGNILKKDKAVFMGWYKSNSAETPEKVQVKEGQTGIDLSTLSGDPNYIPEKMPTDIVLASLEDPSSTAEMGETDLHFHAIWAADANGDGIPESSISGVNTVDLTYDFNSGTGKDSAESYTASDVEKATNWPIADTAPTGDDVPTKANATLVGWSTSPNDTGTTPAATKAAVDALVKTEVDTTGTDPKVYAVWAADVYPGSNGAGDPDGDDIPDYFQVKYEAGDGVTDVAMPVDNNRYEKDDDVKVKPTDYGEKEPTRAGWKFDGWTLKDDTSGTVYKSDGDNKTFKKNDKLDILVAKWTPEGYAVVYHGNGNTGGTVPADQSVDANTDGGYTGKTFDAAENTGSLTRDYATFLGWTTDKDQGLVTKATDLSSLSLITAGQSGVTFTPVSGTRVMDLYAVWAVDMLGKDGTGDGKADYKQVIYDANAGHDKVDGMPTDDTEYTQSTTVNIKEGTPTRAGYTFKGWQLSNPVLEPKPGEIDGTGNPVYDYSELYTYGGTYASFLKTDDTDILYAIWAPAENTHFMVIYRPNHATGGNVPIDTNVYTKNESLSINVMANMDRTVSGTSGDSHDNKKLERDGAIFLGWTLHPNVDLITSSDAKEAAEIIGNSGTATSDTEVTLEYAKYQGNIYNNVLNIFAVWAADENKNGTEDYNETPHTIAYNAGASDGTDGPTGVTIPETGYNEENILQGLERRTANRLTVPDGQRFIFLGWKANVELQKPEGGTITTDETIDPGTLFKMPNSYVIFTAQWYKIPENQYSVVYHGNGADTGSVIPFDSRTYIIGASVTLQTPTAAFKRTGATFLGWSKNEELEMITTSDKYNEAQTKILAAGDTTSMERASIPEGGGEKEYMELYAVWAQDENGNDKPDYEDNELTYDFNGGKIGEEDKTVRYITKTTDTDTVELDTSIQPVQEKKVFIGWSTTPNPPDITEKPKAGTTVDKVTMADGKATVYAVWAADTKGGGADGDTSDGIADYLQHNVTFTQGDGVSGAIGMPEGDKAKPYTNVQEGTAVVLPAAPTRTGYTFAGWKLTTLDIDKSDLKTDSVYPAGTSFTMPEKDIVFAATWTEVKYQVVYHGNGNTGGTVPAADTGFQLIGPGTYNKAVNFPEAGDMVRTGATFLGWSTEELGLIQTSTALKDKKVYTSADTDIPFNPTSAGDTYDLYTMNLYAVWAIDRLGDGVEDYLQVFYDANVGGGETVAVPETHRYTEHNQVQKVSTDKDNPERTGYVFKGWSQNNPNPDKSVTLLQVDDEISPSDTAITLYAIWEGNADTYSVIYRENNATSGSVPVDVNKYVNDKSASTEDVLDEITVATNTGDLGRTDATLIGWSLKEKTAIQKTDGDFYEAGNKIKVSSVSESAVAGVISLYAVWAEDLNNNGTPDYEESAEFTLTYNAGEGKIDGEAIKVDDTKYLPGYTTKLDSGIIPTHKDVDGHKVIFIGWTSDSTYTTDAKILKSGSDAPGMVTEVTFGTTDVGANQTVYAVWAIDENDNGLPDYTGEDNQIRFTYDFDGGYINESTSSIIRFREKPESDIEVTLNKELNPKRGSGNVFVGWTDEKAEGDELDGGHRKILTKDDAAKAKSLLKDTVTIHGKNNPESELANKVDYIVYAVYAVDTNGNNHADYDEYTITYDPGERSDAANMPVPLTTVDTYYPGQAVTLSDKVPTAANYSFQGWKVKTVGGTAESDGKLYQPGGIYVMPSGNVVLEAQWAEKNGDVKYDYNFAALDLTDNTSGDITGVLPKDSNKYAPGDTVTVQGVALTYEKKTETAAEGAVFLGWSTTKRTLLTSAPAEGSVLTADGTTPFAVNTSDNIMTLYAVWALDADKNGQADYIDGLCTIVYDDGVEGGSDVKNLPPTVSVNPEEDYTISDIEPSRTGYRFTGWKLKKSDGTIEETIYKTGTDNVTVSSDKLTNGTTVTLVAQWEAAYGVIYRANYGTGTVPTHSGSYAENGKGDVTLDNPTGLSREGYTFLGWTAHYAADPVTTKEAEAKLLAGTGEPDKPENIKMYKVGDSETKPTFTLSPDNDTYMIFYAVWAVDVNKNSKPDYSEDTWTLVYDAGEDHTIDGETDTQKKEVTDDQSYISGATVYLDRSVKPKKTAGVTFIGWSETEHKDVYTTEPVEGVLTETVKFGDNDTPASTKTVYAVYAQDNDGNDIADYLEGKVRLIYDLNGGTLNGSSDNVIIYYDSTTEERNVTLNNSRVPTHDAVDGKKVIFVGWTTTKPENFDTPFTDDIENRDKVNTLKKDSVDLRNTDITVYAMYAVDVWGNGDTDGTYNKPNGVPDYNKYKVEYNLGTAGGSEVTGSAPTDIHAAGHEPGDLIDLQDINVHVDGYEFIGWKDDGDGSVYVPDSTHSGKYTMPERNVTFTAQWIESDGYIVRYNLNGGTGAILDSGKYVEDETNKGTYYIIQGDTRNYKAVIPENKPTRSKAVFLGWSTEPHDVFTSAPDGGIVCTADNAPAFKPEEDGRIMNLYAVWAINENESAPDTTPDYEETKLNIKYENGVLEADAADSKTVNNMPTDAQVLKGLSYTIPNITPSRTGYSFVEWSGSDGNKYKPGDTIESVGENITLTATWSAAYHVSYNANGGTGAPVLDTSKTYTLGAAVTIDTSSIPTRDGYVFLGYTAHAAQDPVETKEAETKLTERDINSLTEPKLIKYNGSAFDPASVDFKLSPDNTSYMIFYAVWAVDANKNGTADYDEQWHIIYNHNGGTFDAHQDSKDYTISALTYPSSPNTGDGDMVFLNNAVKPTHTAINGVPVTFAGWTEDKSYADANKTTPVKAALSADEENALAEKLVDYVRMPKVADWNKTDYQHDGNGGYYPVYAVWAVDNDKDGIPDYQENKMRLIYNLDGGKFGGGTADIIRYLERPTENGTITLNETFKPTRGKKEVFVGWTTIEPTGSPNNAVTTNPTDTAGFCNNNTVSVTANQAELTVYAVYAKDEWGNNPDAEDPDDAYNKPNGVPDYNKYMVTYELGTTPDGTEVTGIAVPTDKHTAGHEPGDLVDLADALTYTGFTFVGWKDVDGDGSVYMPDSEHNSKYTMPDRDVKFVAQWIDSDRYMVRYHLNGGTGTAPMDSNLYAKSTVEGETDVYYLVNEGDSVSTIKTVTLKEAGTMTRDNAVFLGWSVNEPKALVTTKAADTGYSNAGAAIDYAPETGGVIMNLYAVWAINENEDWEGNTEPDYNETKISVTFEANDGDADDGTGKVDPNTMPPKAENLLKGVDYNIPGREPVREGYTFLGWKLQTGATINDVGDTLYKYGTNGTIDKSIMTKDITLVAQWGASYGVAYHANGGTDNVPTDEVKYELGANVTVKFDKIPERKGYKFLGWSKNKQYEPLTEEPSGDDMLLQGEAETTAFAVEENSTVMNLYALWAVDANDNDTPDYNEQWHIVYDHNGGALNRTDSEPETTTTSMNTYISGERVFLNSGVKPTHGDQDGTKVVFVGWTSEKVADILPSNVDSAAQPTLITNVTMPDESKFEGMEGKVTVYAVWALDVDSDGVADYLENKVRLIYKANGGKFGTGADASEDDVIVYYDAASERTVTLNESRELSRNPGEVFVGWSTIQPTGDKDPITVGAANRKDEIDKYLEKEVSLTTTDVIVYAVYAVDEDEAGTPGYGKPDYDYYTVTYDLNGGMLTPAPVDTNKYEPGEIVTINENEPVLANNTFIGWKSSDESDTTKYRANDSFVMPSQDIKLTAQWEEKAGKVEYDLNGGSGTKPVDNAGYNAGDTVEIKEASGITRDNAVFLGWSPTKRSTPLTETPAENSIFNAAGTTGTAGGDVTTLTEIPFASDEVGGTTMTLYAVWAADENGNGTADYAENRYHVIYDHNGGTYDGAETTTSSTDYLPGTTVALHADIIPTREPSAEGYKYYFVGWTTDKRKVLEQNDAAPKDEDLITHVTISKDSPANITVYALWAIDTMGDGTPDYQDGKVKLIYNFDGGKFSERTEIDRYLDASTEDRTVTLNETFKPVRGEEEVFIGWTLTPPPTEHRAAETTEPDDLLKDGLEIKSTDTVITVYAVYAVDTWGNNPDAEGQDDAYNKPNGVPDYNKHKVTYDLGYYPAYQDVPIPGDAPTDVHNVTGGHEPGDFVDLQMPPTVDGVIFEGWKDIDGDDSVYMPGDDGRKYTMPDRDVDFVAQWIKGDRYTVTYNDNDATSGDVPTDDTEYILEETTQTSELTKYFYFISSGENAGKRYYNVNIKDQGTLKKDNAVFVGWTLKPLDPITLDPDAEESKVTYYTEASDLAYAPEEGGKIMNFYALWAVDADSDGIADYAEGRYTIKYKNGVNPEDADYADPQIENMPVDENVLPNEDYVIPANYAPTRSGYTFDCWMGSDGKEYNPGDTIDKAAITGEFTLTAQWLPDDTVRYHANNGTGTPPVDTNKYANGNDVTLLSDDGLTMEGCLFIGWTLHESYPVIEDDAPTMTYYAAGEVIPYEHDRNGKVMNVYALWAADKNDNGNPDFKDLKVTYADGVNETDPDYNAESSPVNRLPEDVTGLKPGDTVTIPTQKPTRPSYTFVNWINAETKEVFSPGDTVVVNKNITLTASWEKKPTNTGGSSGGGGGGGIPQYTLKYETNGGSEIASERYNSGREVTLDKTPTREGYVFDGWYSDKGLTQKVDKIKITNNTTVYAKWVEEKPQNTPKPDGSDGTGSGNGSSSDILNTEDHFAYVIGYVDGTVRPGNNITRSETVAIFYRLLKADVRNSNMSETNNFNDVSADAWYNVAVSTLANVGIVSGRSETEFAPNEPITRAEFAALCARFDDSEISESSIFSDIDDSWAKPEIERAAALGWVSGYVDGTFKPTQLITRAEAITMINNVLGRVPESVDDLGEGMIEWSDNSDRSAWFYLAIQEATNGHYAEKKNDKYEKWTKVDQSVTWDK